MLLCQPPAKDDQRGVKLAIAFWRLRLRARHESVASLIHKTITTLR